MQAPSLRVPERPAERLCPRRRRRSRPTASWPPTAAVGVWPLCTLDGRPSRVLGPGSARAHAGPGTGGGVRPTCFLGSLAAEVLKVPSAFQDTNACVFCLTPEELLRPRGSWSRLRVAVSAENTCSSLLLLRAAAGSGAGSPLPGAPGSCHPGPAPACFCWRTAAGSGRASVTGKCRHEQPRGSARQGPWGRGRDRPTG